ncbi:MAG: hypothetical protein D6772_08915, partial [Bacteroidetes bacterium]
LTLLSATSANGCPVIILDNQTEIGYSDTRLSLLSVGGANGLDISCAEAADGAIAMEVSGGFEPYTYAWETGESTAIRTDLGPGTYRVSVTDQSGCTVSDELSLEAPLPLIAQLSSRTAGCFGTASGVLQIDTVIGGSGGYAYELASGQAGSIVDFPFALSNLTAGTYTVLITDANACVTTQTINVPSGRELLLRLPADTAISLGETLDLSPILNFTPVDWTWTPGEGLSPDSVLSPLATPLRTTEYILTAVDEFGCTASDAILVLVNEQIPIYIPTAFSPNGDGRNDLLVVFGSEAVEEIEQFVIFDRWGNQVHESGGFAPNTDEVAWDGQYRDQPLNAGVFVYVVKFRLTNGQVIQQAGEVLLMR